MRRLIPLSLATLALLGSIMLAGCLQLRFDREAMLGSIVDTVILPAHLALTQEAGNLDELAREFAREPERDTQALEELRAGWLATELAWKQVELYEFPGLLLLHNAIERRPARVPFIEEAIAEADDTSLETVDSDLIESLGIDIEGAGHDRVSDLLPGGRRPIGVGELR